MALGDEPQAHLLVDGEQLAEYDDEDTFPKPGMKSKYVEAAPGSEFAVQVTVPRRLARHAQDVVYVQTYLDGKRVTGNVMKHGYGGLFEIITKGVSRNTDRGVTLEKFKFAELRTTDGSVDKLKIADFKELGNVEVRCIWAREIGALPDLDYNGSSFKPATELNVPEKCLKGRAISSHATTAAPTVIGGPPVQYVDASYPYGNDPFAIFKFKYRSRRDLQIEGVIPRSPTPVPLEERDPDDLTTEEARELLRRMRQREQEQIEIKKEGKKRARSPTFGGDSEVEEVSVTGERPVRKRSRPSTDSGIEVVDLTDD